MMSGEQLSQDRAGEHDAERPSRAEAERAMRRLLREYDLPEPDDILDHEDGIMCLWHEPKVAIIVELEPRAA
jgi:hypothetical protein